MNDTVPASAASDDRHHAALQALHRTLYDLWQFGANALVGWLPTPRSIEVLTIPKIRLFNLKALPRRVFAGDRLMGPQAFAEVGEVLGAQPLELRMAQPIGNGPGELPPHLIERVFSRFVVTKTDYRAVILLDIVGFSKFTPEEQASQLATLEFALNIAAEAARERDIGVDIARSTTGDGFYVWNRNKGIDGDVDLFVTLALFMTYASLLRRRVTVPAAVPTLRTAVSIGSHYSYHQPDRDGSRDAEYIVGDVTIALARVIQRTAPNQIVVGDFQRPDENTGQTESALGFVELVARRLAAIKGLEFLGIPLQRYAFYLTRAPGAGDDGLDRLTAVDKHGFEHLGFNARIDIYLGAEDALHCGLEHAELVRESPTRAN